MLAEWLHQTNPSPSWEALAEALDSLGHQAKATEIREKLPQLTVARLSGVPVTHTEQVTVDNETRTLSWAEHGLKIHIAQGTLPDVESECTFTLGVTCDTSNFQFPPNGMLVTPMYYIKPSVELLKPVKLEIEHCCDFKSEKGSKQLRAVLAHTTSQNPPYKFESMKDGDFPVDSSWGRVTVSSFTWYAFLLDAWNRLTSSSIVYFARVYYQQVARKSYKISIYTSRNLTHCKVTLP